MGFDFDIRNFGLGFGAGVLTTVVVRRIWQALMRDEETDRGRTGDRRERVAITGGGHRRYTNELIRFCQQNHLAGQRINFSDLLVEPLFIEAESLITMPEDEVNQDVFSRVPRIHDYPSLHAPYNLPTRSIDDLERSERFIALLGPAGSGRTSALMAVILRNHGRLQFEKEQDDVQTQLDAEEAALNAEERAERVKRRTRMAQLMRNKLAETTGGSNFGDTRKGTTRFSQLAPVYVHAAQLPVADFRQQTDPAEPLVRALMATSTRLTARTMPRALYRSLGAGRNLVLIDGVDEVPAKLQARTWDWLQAFCEQYPANTIIVAAGLGARYILQMQGFAIAYMRPFSDLQHRQLLSRLSNQWARLTGDKNSVPRTEVVEQMAGENRLLSPAQALLRTWAAWAGTEATAPGSWVHAYLASQLDDIENWWKLLESAGRLALNDGFIQLQSLHEINTRTPLVAPTGRKPRDEVQDNEGNQPGQEDRQARQRLNNALNQLQKKRILLPVAQGYQFCHPIVGAYCASQGLHTPRDIYPLAQQPAWHSALGYAAERIDLDDIVAIRLDASDEPDIEMLLQLTQWLPHTDKSAQWRADLLRYLGNLLIAPSQYSRIRARIMAALVSTGDDGVIAIARKAVQTPIPYLKQLGCLALGAMRDGAAAKVLVKLLGDQNDDVQIAATLALGAISTREGIEGLVEALQLSPNEVARKAAAEMLAADPELGHHTLYGAITDEDILVRRAAIFGLGRIPADWSILAINEVFVREDEEYYVRSAAEVVFLDIYNRDSSGIEAYPPVSSVPWLANWATEQIRSGSLDPATAGAGLLQAAIQQEQDLLVRKLAIDTGAQLGVVETLPAIYQTLAHQNPILRDTAMSAILDLKHLTQVELPVPFS